MMKHTLTNQYVIGQRYKNRFQKTDFLVTADSLIESIHDNSSVALWVIIEGWDCEINYLDM